MSVIPDSIQRKMTDSFDLFSGGYLFHILAYAVLCLLGMINAEFHNNRFPFRMLGLVLIYGTLLELIQYFLPYRTFNPYDILSNLIGVAVGCFLFVTYLYFTVKHRRLNASYPDSSLSENY
jgi:VanZ family protein